MNRSLLLGAIFALACGQFANAEEQRCVSLSGGDGDALVALSGSVAADELLRVQYDESLACVVTRATAGIEQQASSSLRLNVELNELAVGATVDGLNMWLRLDAGSSGALLLDRQISEELGLTDAEFLGDNSLLEASDFFIEFVGSLEIGSYSLRNIETNIPHLEIPYEHYAGRDLGSAGQSQLTVGSIGEELLEELIITLDLTNGVIYLAEAR